MPPRRLNLLPLPRSTVGRTLNGATRYASEKIRHGLLITDISPRRPHDIEVEMHAVT